MALIKIFHLVVLLIFIFFCDIHVLNSVIV